MNEKKSYNFEDKLALDKNYPNLFIDKKNPNRIIKIIKNEDEYKLSKILEHTGFTPKFHDLYIHKDTYKIPKYTREQERIRAKNYVYKNFPEKQQDIGLVQYEDKTKYTYYLIMEKINGNNLMHNNYIENIKNNIDEIYRLYNVLSDKGFVFYDLFARNMILSEEGKIYFIDFDSCYIENTLESIPIDKRLSKEKLMKSLLDDAYSETIMISSMIPSIKLDMK